MDFSRFYTATGLTAGTTLRFYVTATNASGESGPSTHVSAPLPTGVAGVSAAASSDGSSVTVTWTPDPTAVGYLIGRIDDSGSSTVPVLVGTVSAADLTLNNAGQATFVDGPGDLASGTSGAFNPNAGYTYFVGGRKGVITGFCGHDTAARLV